MAQTSWHKQLLASSRLKALADEIKEETARDRSSKTAALLEQIQEQAAGGEMHLLVKQVDEGTSSVLVNMGYSLYTSKGQTEISWSHVVEGQPAAKAFRMAADCRTKVNALVEAIIEDINGQVLDGGITTGGTYTSYAPNATGEATREQLELVEVVLQGFGFVVVEVVSAGSPNSVRVTIKVP